MVDTKSLNMTASLNSTANNTQDSWRVCQQCLWGRGGRGEGVEVCGGERLTLAAQAEAAAVLMLVISTPSTIWREGKRDQGWPAVTGEVSQLAESQFSGPERQRWLDERVSPPLAGSRR